MPITNNSNRCTYWVDVDGRLVLLLRGSHPKYIICKLLISLIEMRRGHDDWSTYRKKKDIRQANGINSDKIKEGEKKPIMSFI